MGERQKRRAAHTARCKKYAKDWADRNVDRIDTPAFRAELLKVGIDKLGNSPRMWLVCAEISRRMRSELELPAGDWKRLPGFPRVAVSSSGDVISCARQPAWYPLRTHVSNGGYHTIVFRSSDRKSHCLTIHSLVLSLFGPPRPSPHHVARHWDDDKTNNNISNLLWGTSRDNALDAIRNSKSKACLGISIVRKIYQASGTDKAVAAAFKVGIQQVRGIRNGSRYADFTRGLVRGDRVFRSASVRDPNKVYALTDDQVHKLRIARAAGRSYASLSREFGVHESVIRGAVQGKQYSWVKTPVVPPTPLHKRIKNLPTPLTLNPVEHGRLYDPDHKPPKEVS